MTDTNGNGFPKFSLKQWLMIFAALGVFNGGGSFLSNTFLFGSDKITKNDYAQDKWRDSLKLSDWRIGYQRNIDMQNRFNREFKKNLKRLMRKNKLEYLEDGEEEPDN